MSKLTEREEEIGRYYDEVIFESEVTRLETMFPVEYAITARHLERWIPEGSTVAEVGVGGGLYSELLAKRGCRLHLVDVSEKLLDAATERLRAGGFDSQIISVDHASATNLDCLPAAAFDAVLMLGPLYHLLALAGRRRAVEEAARVLKAGGVLIAAGINRLDYLRDLFREAPQKVLMRRDFIQQYLRDGNLNPEIAPPIGHSHTTTVEEFRALFAEDFEELTLVAIESFASPWQSALNELPKAEAEAWLDLIEQTGTMPEAFGLADHFLYVGSPNQYRER
ncbi:MAG: class I SAM-dependent methyltransferase [Blastocatellia bacterium]